MIFGRENAGVMRTLAEAVAWAVALLLAWVATLSTISAPEIVAGVVAALLGGGVAALARRVIGQAWRPTKDGVAWLPPLALAIPADTVRLLGRALPRLLRDRGAGGTVRELPPPPAEELAVAAFRQAWGLMVLSASPGSVVVDWPPDGRPPLVHELGSGPPRLAERVTR